MFERENLLTAALAVVAVLLAAIFLLPGESDVGIFPDDGPCESCEKPDPIEDLAGLLMVEEEELYVMPGHLEGVLEALDATWVTEGSYEIELDDGTLAMFAPVFVDHPGVVFSLFLDRSDLISESDTLRVWKNAKCKKIRDGSWVPCSHGQQGTEYENYKIEKKPLAWCVKGNSYCVERRTVVNVFHFYDLADCTMEIGSKNMYGFTCKL